MAFEIRSGRVILRDWRDSDLPAWIAMNADPEVMRYFVSTVTPEQSTAEANRIRARSAVDGFTFWALEIPGVTDFAGFVGLIRTGYETPFTPCVEVGWRLAKAYWGKGYASEAAQLALAYGFETLGLDEIVSMTTLTNLPSQKVMQRIGMHRDVADDFGHPRVPADHPLHPHLLYRLKRDEWLAQQAQ